MKTHYCNGCNTSHESSKWYNDTNNNLVCRKIYLQKYYTKHAETINEERRKRYKEDKIYRENINKKNTENIRKRRANGYRHKRKPRSEWSVEEKRKAKEAKQRYKEAHPDRIIEQNKKFHTKHYKENIEKYRLANEKSRKTMEYQYSYLQTNATRRKHIVQITFDQYKKKRVQLCHYCNRRLEETGTCLDILDNSSNIYNDEGTVPCCHICNYIKGSYLTEEEMLHATLALKQYKINRNLPVKINYPLYVPKTNLTAREVSIKYKCTSMIRNLENKLTTEDFQILLNKNCFYCGGISTGLDRVDNTKGYYLDNCVPCCVFCNRIKSDFLEYDETLVIISTTQKIKLFNNLNLDKVCDICNTEVSPKWIKHPLKESYLCAKHYKDVFQDIHKNLNACMDFDIVYTNFSEKIYNSRHKKKHKPKIIKKNLQTFEKNKNLIESKQMNLLTTFEEYKKSQKHKKLTIQCNRGHVFHRTCERITTITTCPECKGLSNKGGAFKEKLTIKGWEYISGMYLNKNSKLIVTCKHGIEFTKKYLWLRDHTCNCSNN